MPIVACDLVADGSPFSPEERAIFAYGLAPGSLDHFGDPLAIEERYKTLLADKNPSALGQWLSRDNVSVRLLGYRRFLPVVRSAFGLPLFSEANPGGLTGGDALALLDRFFAFLDRLEAKYRREAELLVTYGPLPGRIHSYEREVGLWVNRGRAQGFAGLAHWRGAIAAAGASKAHFDLVNAMAANATEAHELEQTIEADRQQAIAQAASRTKGGG